MVKVNYSLGGKVKKGDILFEIDKEDFEREIEVLEKQLIQAEASLSQDYNSSCRANPMSLWVYLPTL